MNDRNSEEPKFYEEWLELDQNDQDFYNEIYDEQFFHSFNKVISNQNISANIENNDSAAGSKKGSSKLESKQIKTKKNSQNKCNKRKKKYSIYDENTQQVPNHVNDLVERICSLEGFIEYLNYKINKDKKIKVTKNELVILYQQLKKQLPFGELTRSEKRSKNKIFEKLYPERSNIINFLENYPKQFLEPVFLFQNSKIKSRKKYDKRIKA